MGCFFSVTLALNALEFLLFSALFECVLFRNMLSIWL